METRVAAVDGSGNWLRGEVYAAGRHIATYTGGTSGNTYFDLADHLGTERARVTVGGTVCETIQNLPFGDGMKINGSCEVSPMHFTGKERDSETGNDNFKARYYGSSMGRFLSPDPSGISLADLSNPQSLNMYAYVFNNPLSFVDPTGLDGCQNNWNNNTLITNCVVSAGANSCSMSDNFCQMQYQQMISGQAVTTTSTLAGLRSQPQTTQTQTQQGAACVAQRIASGIKAGINIGVGITKGFASPFSAASMVATGPLGAAGAAYLVIGAAGNFAAAGAQIAGALTGNISGTSNAATLFTTITSFAGFSALLRTGGNLETASGWATAESLGTASLNAGRTGQFIDQAASFAAKLFTAVDFGQNAADAVGLNTNGSCH